MAANTTQLTPPPPASIAAAVLAALAEDIGSGDLTAALVPETQQALGIAVTGMTSTPDRNFAAFADRRAPFSAVNGPR